MPVDDSTMMNTTNNNNNNTASSSTNRYLDVLTIRSNSTTKVSTTTIGANHNLLFEPVMLPNLQHLALDKLDGEVAEDCMFYPTGESNRSMRRTMELAIRSCNPVNKNISKNDSTLSLSIGKSDSDVLPRASTSNGKVMRKRSTIRPSSIVAKEAAKPLRKPLYHVRGLDNNTLVLKDMIERVRDNENKLTTMVIRR